MKKNKMIFTKNDWIEYRKKRLFELPVIGIVSGYFSPLHCGHINYLNDAAKICDVLIVIINNDKQVTLKNSIPFMDEWSRKTIISNIRCVDDVFISIDEDESVSKTLKVIHKLFKQHIIFMNGGDVTSSHINTKEKEICEKYGIKTVFNVGGDKIESSTNLIKKAVDYANQKAK